MPQLARTVLAWKALRELGLAQLMQYARYQVSLRTGALKRASQVGGQATHELSPLMYLRPLIDIPELELLNRVLGEEGRAKVLTEAEEIVAGQVRLFGGEAVPLQLTCPKPLHHWTAYELGKATAEIGELHDIKLGRH